MCAVVVKILEINDCLDSAYAIKAATRTCALRMRSLMLAKSAV